VGGIFNYFISLCFTYMNSLAFCLVEPLLVFYIFNDEFHSFFWGGRNEFFCWPKNV